MGVYIKGMEMPESCLECRLFNDPWCMAKNRNQWRTAYNRPPIGEKQKDCPLVEMPTPHGRLIDADALLADVRAHSESYFADDFAHEWVDVAPTIIPAEEGET